MRHAIILGTGGHSRVIVSMIAEAGHHPNLTILGLEELRNGESILGFSVDCIASSLDKFAHDFEVDIFLAIGSNELRKHWWDRIKKLDFSTPNLISPNAVVSQFSIFGEGNIVCANAYIGPECKLGDNNLVNTGSILEHEVLIGSNCHFAPNSTIAGRSRIGDDCFIGAGATVIDGLSIAPRNTLGAGSTLINSIQTPNNVYVGVPARKAEGNK